MVKLELGLSVAEFTTWYSVNATRWGIPLMFMFPIFLNSIGYALIFSVSYGRALAIFPTCAASAAALFGLIQMAGAAILLSLTQKILLPTPMLIALHMFLLLPVLCVFIKNKKPLLKMLVEV